MMRYMSVPRATIPRKMGTYNKGDSDVSLGG